MRCSLGRWSRPAGGLSVLAAAMLIAGCSPSPSKPAPGKPEKKAAPAASADSSKPASEKPADQKPADAKSAQAKSADAKPAGTTPAPSEKKMSVTKKLYGKLPDGKEVDVYTLTNANGMKVQMITYGATIVAVETPDRNGKPANITLFRDSLEDYLNKDTPYFGSTVGRYANRIAKGKFTLDGTEYTLATNNGPNHLHGGIKGFDKVLWTAKPVEGQGFVSVEFTYESPDSEEGYPGKCSVKAVYTLTDKDELQMEFSATSDKPTIINLCNHAYWNLAGAGAGDCLGHELMLAAARYLPVNKELIPTGELKPVKSTPMDFTNPETIGARLKEVKGDDPKGGYDHCYVLDRKPEEKELSLAARVVEPTSGRVMEIFTTQPAIQFYSGNFLDGTIKAGGKTYQQHAAFCLETEHYPDSPNHPEFPSTVLRPGETYKQATVHKFSVQK